MNVLELAEKKFYEEEENRKTRRISDLRIILKFWLSKNLGLSSEQVEDEVKVLSDEFAFWESKDGVLLRCGCTSSGGMVETCCPDGIWRSVKTLSDIYERHRDFPPLKKLEESTTLEKPVKKSYWPTWIGAFWSTE